MTDEILIERKANLDEVAGNIKSGKTLANDEGKILVYIDESDLKDYKVVYVDEGGERERFKFELTRIRNCRAKLFLYIEDQDGDKNIRFGVYQSKYDPKSFLATLKSFEAEFDFAYKFYDKSVVGSEVYQTIKYQIRNTLKKGKIFKNIYEEGDKHN